MNMKLVEDWLATIPSKYTRKTYIAGIKKFEEFYGKDIEVLIGSQEAGKTIEKFYAWLKNKGTPQNTCRNLVNSPIQFLKYFKTEVNYRKNLGIYKTVVTTRDHMVTIAEVQEMAKVADLREQILLEVFLLGLRVGDVSKLKWRTFDVNAKAPAKIMIYTGKEDVVAQTFISEEFQGLLQKYLERIDKSNKFLFQSNRRGYLSPKRINQILKDLVDRAGIKTHGLFRWHIGRKLFLRNCAELGINAWNAKIMCGKSVPADILTYINGVQLKDDFLKVAKVLRLFPKITPQTEDQIKNMEKAIGQLENENIAFKTRIDLLQKDFQKLKETVEKLYPRELKRYILDEKGEIKEFTETYATPEEYLEAERKFMREVLLRGKSKEERKRLKNAEFVFDKFGRMSKEDLKTEFQKLRQKKVKE